LADFATMMRSERGGMSLPVLVMKFGGTSVGSPERIRHAAGLIHGAADGRPVVAVVSAMAKVTDLLLETMRLAEAGEQALLEERLRELRRRHHEACSELFAAPRRTAVLDQVEEILQRFEHVARGMLMLRACPASSADEAVSTGEKLSALLVSAVLEDRGARAEAVDAARLIVTDAAFGAASPLMEETAVQAQQTLPPLLEEGTIPVVTGFNGATAGGRPTTLGRGGSDFSASLLAAALDAGELWIWTDVDGILTADPRVTPEARVLSEVTFNEAAELSYNGAKVLHPRTLAPLAKKDIPVWIKNSFAPEKPGTRIVSVTAERPGARAITSLGGVALISIEAVSASLSGARLMAQALDAAARANVEVLLLTRSSFRQNFCMLVRNEELEAALESLRNELALELAHGYVHPIEVDKSVGLLAVVGEGMRGTPGLAGRIFTAISRRKINIIAIAQGSSELTIAIVVRKTDLEDAVRAVHAECRLGEVRAAAPALSRELEAG